MRRYNEDVTICLNCGGSFVFEPNEGVEQEIRCYHCNAVHIYKRTTDIRLKNEQNTKRILVKIIPIINRYERNKLISQFEDVKGNPAVICVNWATFCSHINGFTEPEYDGEEQWVDGTKYIITNKIVYGAEIILSDNILVLI